MAVRRARIAGVGKYLPPRVVTNDDLAEMMETSDEWIRQRTGIETRHWLEGNDCASDMAVHAAKQALDDAGVKPEDVQMVVFATTSPDHEFPGTGCFFQTKMGIPAGTASLDIRQACTGFIYALSIADQFIRGGVYDRVLVIGSESQSKSLDKTDAGRDMAVLFGDGAGAVVVESTVVDGEDDAQIFSSHLHADGKYAKELWMDAPTQTEPGERITHAMIDEGRHYPQMNGKLVFVHASKRMPESVMEALEANGKSIDDLDMLFFHQANLRINQQVAKGLGVPDDKVFNTIQKYGNTTAATIPIGMRDAIDEDVLKPGMLVGLSAFGSGFTWASTLLRF